MNRSCRSRRQPTIGAEFLESRHLLTAHVTHHPAVHVAATPAPLKPLVPPKPPAPPKAPHEIAGTLVGLETGTSNPNNSIQGYDTYSASASTKSGTATYFGTDAYTSTMISPSTYEDTYFNGTTVLYLAGGNDVSINYVGKGPYPAADTGPFSATLKGEAIGITGALTGHAYSFTATLEGDAVTGAVAIKFTLKD
jgi:hypothetical protein